MKPCFGYTRVSTAKQGEGVSLEAQRDAINRFADTNGITITRWFEEKETAAKRGRPVFNLMVRELRKRRANGVVLHRVDRGARNPFDWARIGALSDAGIDVHIATENLDFRSRGGRLAADIQAVIAADYVRNLRDETLKGMYGRLKQGLYPFKAPIGYRNEGKGNPKSVDPVSGPLVAQAFELYASGQHSIRTLRVEMERRGLRSIGGTPVTKGGIEKILGNPFYTGVIRIKRTGETFQGIHKPLVSVATFQRVQDVRAGKAGKKVTRHNHTYRGLFHCAACGLAMIPERQKGHVYYRCQKADCPSNCVREDGLETAVAAKLQGISLSDAVIDAIEAAVAKWAAEDPDHEIRTCTLRLAKIERRLEQLTDALLDKLIDQVAFNTRKERLLLEQADLKQRIERHRNSQPNPRTIRAFLERVKSLVEHYIFAPPAEKREIVEIAFSNRRVWNKKVYLEPSNWFQATQEAVAVFCGDPSRPTSRRHLKKLALVAKASEESQKG